MSKYAVTMTADATTFIATANRRNGSDSYFATLFAYGTWGGGTIAWQWSPDGGTTKLSIKDQMGSAITSTANDSFNISLGTGGSLSTAPLIYATLSGSTGPALTVGLLDNN